MDEAKHCMFEADVGDFRRREATHKCQVGGHFVKEFHIFGVPTV